LPSLPAIACDIDGVALRGTQIIGHSSTMIKELLTTRPVGQDLDTRIPFIFLTNGGGFIEERKAENLNEYLQLTAGGDECPKLTANHVIQCHTPLREAGLVEEYRDKYVLVCGYDEVLDAALKYGYEKAIHVDELAAVYPNAVPMDIPILQKDRLEMFHKDLETRFKKSVEELRSELRFAAIFIMHGVVYSDLTIQLFSDILASKDGHILGERRTQGDP